MKSYQKSTGNYRYRINNYSLFLIIFSLTMPLILVLVHSPSSVYAQMQSKQGDLIGIYRFSGESNSHLEFLIKDGKLIATRVYDSPTLKKQYGERESFFEATLNGRKFSGIITSSSTDKGLPISGEISSDKRTIEWVGKDSQGIQYTSIIYKEDIEELKMERDSQFRREVGLGFEAYKKQQYDEAISHHQKALQIDPENKEAFKVHCALGANYFRKGHLDEALNKTQKCLELKADYAVGNGLMGDLLSSRGNQTVACMYYKKGCDLGFAFSCASYRSQCLSRQPRK